MRNLSSFFEFLNKKVKKLKLFKIKFEFLFEFVLCFEKFFILGNIDKTIQKDNYN